MTSTRSSDYAAIRGGGNGIGGGSQASRRLARWPLPRGKEEEDDDCTPVAFVTARSTYIVMLGTALFPTKIKVLLYPSPPFWFGERKSLTKNLSDYLSLIRQ